MLRAVIGHTLYRAARSRPHGEMTIRSGSLSHRVSGETGNDSPAPPPSLSSDEPSYAQRVHSSSAAPLVSALMLGVPDSSAAPFAGEPSYAQRVRSSSAAPLMSPLTLGVPESSAAPFALLW